MCSWLSFDQQLKNSSPQPEWSDELRAVFYLKKGDLESAHQLVQELNSKAAFHLHGIIHQLEGDHWNAKYWYGRAGVDQPTDINIRIDQILNNLINSK